MLGLGTLDVQASGEAQIGCACPDGGGMLAVSGATWPTRGPGLAQPGSLHPRVSVKGAKQKARPRGDDRAWG